ncbi:hypothetical protein BHM03_00063137, partial [Ensete ventricosum]
TASCLAATTTMTRKKVAEEGMPLLSRSVCLVWAALADTLMKALTEEMEKGAVDPPRVVQMGGDSDGMCLAAVSE